MSKTIWQRKTVIAILFAALLATAVLPALGHPLVQHTASASSGGDSIAVGNSYEDQYDSLILQYANNYGLNPFLLKGQIMLESGFNTYATSQVINAGCGWTHDEGLMQINPVCSGTGSANLFNPSTNIQAGASAMAQLYHQFGSYDLALQAYNIGSNSVASGQRNWAYSSAVDAYATQFENQHAALGGSQGGGGVVSTGPSSGSGSGSGGTYTVQSGDTLYSIGESHGISWQSIASANGIYAPYVIHVGEKLSLSGGGGSSSQTTYTVKSGDTLYGIGQSHGVAWQSIASANGISAPYVIYQGEQLRIP